MSVLLVRRLPLFLSTRPHETTCFQEVTIYTSFSLLLRKKGKLKYDNGYGEMTWLSANGIVVVYFLALTAVILLSLRLGGAITFLQLKRLKISLWKILSNIKKSFWIRFSSLVLYFWRGSFYVRDNASAVMLYLPAICLISKLNSWLFLLFGIRDLNC